jgi:membrane protein
VQRMIRVLIQAGFDFAEDECLTYAAGISYWALFSIFPMLLLVMSTLGLFIHGPRERETAINTVFNLFGGSIGRDAIGFQVDALARRGGQVGIVGLVVAVWTATSVFGAVRSGIARVWGTKSRLPAVHGKVLDLAMVIVVGALLLASVTSTAVLRAVSAHNGALLGPELGAAAGTIIGICGFLIPPVISYAAFAVVYYALPRLSTEFRDVWVGALVAAVLFQLAQIAFQIYLAYFADYGRIYGPLGAVIALLTFMFLSASILLFGAEVTKASAFDRTGSQSVYRD